MISEQAWADAQCLWDFLRMGREPQPCSAAVALGSHDLGVADTAADMYLRGMAPVVVMTGATSPTTQEFMPRGEAVHYRERALELGLPDTAILVEPHARNTGENIDFSRTLLEEAGITVTSVLLVTKPYEERRAFATARKRWPGVEIFPASAPTTLADYVKSIRDPDLVIDMMVGAVQRIVHYPRRGLAIYQVVPIAVKTAYQRLVGTGFTRRLLSEEGLR